MVLFPGKRKAKFKINSQKGVFLGFVLHTTQNCLRYNCETGNIGKANYVCFDEGMHDLPANLIPPNKHDLGYVEQGDKFPAKLNEVDVDKEFEFLVYPFTKMEEKTLHV